MATTSEHLGSHAALPSQDGRRASMALPGAAPALAAGLLACLVYGLTIQTRPAHIDEFYHLLAGRSWAADGSFAILDGRYERARLFTAIVGGSFDLFGRSDLWVARIPSLLFSGISVGLVFQWLRQSGGIWSAVAGAALFGLAGYTLDIAHFARFYALHALMILAAAGSLFLATRPAGRFRPGWLAATALCLAIAAHLQPVTAIAALAMGCWLLFDQRATIAAMRPLHLIVLGAIALACATIALSQAGPALESYRHAERWATGSQDDAFYYLREFRAQMPAMLLLWPVALAAAWRRNPSLASLCAIMAMLCLTLHSFAGMKAWRYSYYVFPFICMAYGLAIGALVERFGGGGTLRPALLAGAAMLLLMGGDVAYRHSARLMASTLAQGPAALAAPVPDGEWDRAAPELRRIAQGSSLLVTGDDLRTLAHIGPFNLFISHSRLGELKPPTDFNSDFRTGRPLIDSPAALSEVIDCTDNGVVIVSDYQWRNPMGVRPEIAREIERRLTPVPTHSSFHVYSWRHPTVRRACPHVGKQALPGTKGASVVRPLPPRGRCVPSGQSCPPAFFGIAATAGAA
ncbi:MULTISPECIES: glycosyltransferase family 39 protein [Sphingobium]|uniref:Glycosyltransferase RgtA/B/C/D-like domain-containing protein n=1 Tax=Sphingobium fuliginis (strain ATCC 27551) TaxID=336203 RepID=A0ABQ1F2K8_SPHSA|nr:MULTISPECIES: glycosyltransferase family 39 protein [Sphingobium]RYL97163.1 hypothetical protein EWH10_15015 [Sphingobium fuliginis]WDA35571.1 glycosyltransferase family 39 protein [Sphingobium sp. YC-XJ3]GFZ96850.1 hypothetical protein GCM10019071_29120 [Sphingobium fuliginis]